MGLSEIDINSDFYEIGGDSIIAIKIVNRYEDISGTRLDPDILMDLCTLKDLAEYIDSTQGQKTNSSIYALEKIDKKDYYPMSSAQMRMYILNHLEGAGTSYNMPMAVSIKGVVDLEKIKLALHKLVMRHEAFRTSFMLVDGIPVQKIHDNVEFETEFMELNEKTVSEVIKAFIRPFDLKKAPRITSYNVCYTKLLRVRNPAHRFSGSARYEEFLQPCPRSR